MSNCLLFNVIKIEIFIFFFNIMFLITIINYLYLCYGILK